MARTRPIPPPDIFPGRFLVLRYDRESETYTAVLDNDDRSSYNLGDSPSLIEARMVNCWKFNPHLAFRAVSAAKTFTAVQVIPADGRIIALIERTHSKRTAFTEPSDDEAIAVAM